MQLHVINTGFFKLDGGAMFGVVPKSIWQKSNPPDEEIPIATPLFFVWITIRTSAI